MMNKKQETRNKGGFTIIESLVAISILMIAISGPLVVASKGLTASIYSRNQMIASYLAQESMEYIKNLRDNNIIHDPDQVEYQNWLGGGLSGCLSSSPCDANAVEDSNTVGQDPLFDIVPQCPTGGCLLRLITGINGKGYTSAGSQGNLTIFKRHFFLEKINPEDPNLIYLDREARAVVEVTWNEGTVENRIRLTSQLTRALR